MKLYFLGLLLGSTLFAYSPLPNRILSSGRCLAMGDACMTFIEDPYMLFYNPARLSVAKPDWTIADVQVHANRGGVSVAKDNAGNYNKIKDVRNLAANNSDRLIDGAGSVMSAFTLKNFGAGAFASAFASDYLNSANSSIEYKLQENIGGFAGIGMSLFRGIIKLGYTAVYLDHGEVDKEFVSNEEIGASGNTDEGTGLSHNAGFQLTLPYTYLPTLALVGRDIGWTVYSKGGGIFTKDSNNAPKARPPSYDAELGFLVKIGREHRANITFGYRDMLNEYEEGASRRIQGGLELNFWDIFFLRGGIMEASPTAGFGVKAFGDSLDFVTYAVKNSSGLDRRFLIQLRMGVGGK